MAGRKVTNEVEARHLLEEAARHGVDRVAWARSRGIDARSLNAWRLNLERRADGVEPRPLRLVELVAQTGRGPQRHLYRVHVDDLMIEVPLDFDPAALTELVRAIRAAC